MEYSEDKHWIGNFVLFDVVLLISGLVVITSMAGYAVAPGTFDLITFLLVSLGTGLTSSSANAVNQVNAQNY